MERYKLRLSPETRSLTRQTKQLASTGVEEESTALETTTKSLLVL